MKRSKTGAILTLAAVATVALVLTASSANAAVISTLTSEAKNGEPHTGPLIVATTGDLLETVGSVAAEGLSGSSNRQKHSVCFRWPNHYQYLQHSKRRN